MATLDRHLASFTTSFSKPDTVQQDTSRQSLNWTKVATAIETRDSVVLIPVLQSWLANMPRDWPFVIWTGRDNHKLLTEAVVFQDEIKSGRLNFTRIDITGSAYRPNPQEPSTLSDLLANTDWFWTQYHVDAEWMMFFQFDSVLCSRSDQTADDWLGYDWVGAPSDWTHTPSFKRHGGNGGLSLRKISSMRAITRETPRGKDEMPEDVYFRDVLEKRNTTRWPEDEGRREAEFSLSQGWMEDETNDASWKPLGIHFGLRHLGDIFKMTASGLITNRLHRVIQHCPEVLYLRYLHEEYQDVDLSEFRLGAKPRPTADDDLLRLNSQYAQQADKLTETIAQLQERLKTLESQVGSGTSSDSPSDTSRERVHLRPPGLAIDNVDSSNSRTEPSNLSASGQNNETGVDRIPPRSASEDIGST